MTTNGSQAPMKQAMSKRTSRAPIGRPPARKSPTTRFLTREPGLLAFNRRVLAQAQDKDAPLLERLRFLCIVSSNMDEFFEIRVAELKERIKLGDEVGREGEKNASALFAAVADETHAIVDEQYRLLNQ